MKTYTLTSELFEGEVIFEFNDLGYLVNFDARGATLNESQMYFILKNMAKHLVKIKDMLDKSKSARFTEIKQDITFDKFWNRYNSKDRSSKKRTLARWNRMSKTQQVKAYNHIGKYELTLKPGIERKYAESYLNAELWNN